MNAHRDNHGNPHQRPAWQPSSRPTRGGGCLTRLAPAAVLIALAALLVKGGNPWRTI